MKVKVYQWLRGDGNSWIDTNYIPKIGDEFSWHCVFPDDAQKFERMFAVEEIGYSDLFEMHWAGGNLPGFSYTPSGGGQYLQKVYHTLDVEDSAIVLHQGNRTLWVFAGNDWRNNIPTYKGITTGKIAYLKIKDKLHLVPCLTSDNEACMLDLLSGTLYRNQGSGSFSVEGEMLYEFETPAINRLMRKPSIVVRLREWLRGDGNSWIDTNYIPLSSDEYKIHAINSGYVSSGGDNALYGRLYQAGVNQVAVVVNSSDYWRAANFGIANNPMTKDSEIDLTLKGSLCVVNNTEYHVEHDNVEYAQGSLFLFARNRDGRASELFNGKVKYFEVVGKLHLRPCEILHHPTLPPQACMIDLLTGNLYTNQGTGNFTCDGKTLGMWTDAMLNFPQIPLIAEKTDSGLKVIWERVQPFVVYRWLKGDGVAWIDSGISDDDIDRIIGFKARNNVQLTDRDEWLFGVRNADGIATLHGVLSSAESRIIIVNGTGKGYVIEGSYEAEVSNSTIKVNGAITTTTSRNTSNITIGIFNMNTNGLGSLNYKFRGSFAYFDIGDLHLTPAVLSRNILPSEDNNGKARYKGECGFADRAKYMRGEPWFFGNVASSGSFSVSDEG